MILRCAIFAIIVSISTASGELVEAECGFVELTKRGLQCEFNNIFTFETTYVNIIDRNSSIDAVSFRQSELFDIPSDIFLKFPLLKHLDAELTQLKVIRPDNFRNADQLKYFLARFNEIQRLESETFASAPQLKFIVLQHNQISYIDAHAFARLNNLEAIYLDYNKMITLPSKMLHGVPNLLHFSMAYNNLTATPDDLFMATPKLETINLGRNMLAKFNDKQFDSLPDLERVQLDHNRLSQLDLIACKSSEINVDKNQLKVIELNKWTRIVSAWDNPVEKLILHEHYGTGRAYNFSFDLVNEIVFFVHEHCCTLENLENFYILTHSFGDLSHKGFDVNDWNCTFAKSFGYETNTGFVTNNVCRKFKGFVARTTTTTSTTTKATLTTRISGRYGVNYDPNASSTRSGIQNIEDTIFSGEVESEEENREMTTRSPLFSQFDYESSSKPSFKQTEYEAEVQESTTESYEKKAEKGLWKTIKSNASKLKNNVIKKWNDWVG